MQPAPFKMNFACGLYDRMQALYTGEVKVQGIELEFLRVEAPRVIFDNMAASQSYDMSEMSCSEYISRRVAGDETFVALPVFPSRSFRHGLITINTQRNILTPKDLEGKRIGVPLYTMTACVWLRGMLEHDHGVDLSKVTWVEGAINAPTPHGQPTLMPMHHTLPIQKAPEGQSLSELLESGQIDAIMGTTLPGCLKTSNQVRRLFPHFKEVEKDYYQRTQLFPIMHLVVIKRSTFAAHPEMARPLLQAFEASKQVALTRMKNLAALRYMLPWLSHDLDEIDELFDGDPWPYGLQANRHNLLTLMQYMVEQGIIAKTMPLEDLFLAC